MEALQKAMAAEERSRFANTRGKASGKLFSEYARENIDRLASAGLGGGHGGGGGAHALPALCSDLGAYDMLSTAERGLLVARARNALADLLAPAAPPPASPSGAAAGPRVGGAVAASPPEPPSMPSLYPDAPGQALAGPQGMPPPAGGGAAGGGAVGGWSAEVFDEADRAFMERVARRQSLERAGADVARTAAAVSVPGAGAEELRREELDYGSRVFGKRRVSESTVRKHWVFEQASQVYRDKMSEEAALLAGAPAGGEQRSSEWYRMREARLTASAFANALGFWSLPGRKSGRVALWEEKLGLAPPFRGNEATAWGTAVEPLALDDYEGLTGLSVGHEMFRVLGSDSAQSWLGGSPDGLIDAGPGEMAEPIGVVRSRAVGGAGGPGGAALPGRAREWGRDVGADAKLARLRELQGGEEGILEIKCPWNKGNVAGGQPWDIPAYYYMPQVQGLLHIYDRPWCQLYCWTYNGSAIYHIPRDEAYWAQAWPVIAEFWWLHVVPARSSLQLGVDVDLREFEPPPVHAGSAALVDAAKRMAAEAERFFFPPLPGSQEKARAALDGLGPGE